MRQIQENSFHLTYLVSLPWLPCFPYSIIDTHFPCIQYNHLFEFKDSYITISDLKLYNSNNLIHVIHNNMNKCKLLCTPWTHVGYHHQESKVDVYIDLFELLDQDC